MKADPKDLRAWAEDLQGTLQRHPDAVKANPDITADVIRARDKAFKRFEEVTGEKPCDPHS